MPSWSRSAWSTCAVVSPLTATCARTSVVSGVISAVRSAGARSTKAWVTGSWSASTASVPTRATSGNLPASSGATFNVAAPAASLRALGSPVSQAPLSFLSRHTSALRMAPSITFVATSTVAGAAGASEPPPPQADSRPEADNSRASGLSFMRVSSLWLSHGADVSLGA